MPIDPLSEQLITFAEAAGMIPPNRSGAKPHVSQIYRYTTHGLRGIHLEWIQAGPRRATSREAVARFFSALTVAAGGSPSQPGGPRQSDVGAELDRAGI